MCESPFVHNHKRTYRTQHNTTRALSRNSSRATACAFLFCYEREREERNDKTKTTRGHRAPLRCLASSVVSTSSAPHRSHSSFDPPRRATPQNPAHAKKTATKNKHANMAPVKLINSPAPVDGDFSNMNLDVGTAVLLMVASTNGQVRGSLCHERNAPRRRFIK